MGFIKYSNLLTEQFFFNVPKGTSLKCTTIYSIKKGENKVNTKQILTNGAAHHRARVVTLRPCYS